MEITTLLTKFIPFSLHIFEDMKLHLGIINDFCSIYTDTLSIVTISKNRSLTILLDSFHRQISIRLYSLSLGLHHLTNTPFEPMQESSFKHLTMKTVFVLGQKGTVYLIPGRLAKSVIIITTLIISYIYIELYYGYPSASSMNGSCRTGWFRKGNLHGQF